MSWRQFNVIVTRSTVNKYNVVSSHDVSNKSMVTGSRVDVLDNNGNCLYDIYTGMLTIIISNGISQTEIAIGRPHPLI